MTQEPEQRAWPRFRYDREIALQPLTGHNRAIHWASVRNLSRGGIGLFLSCPYEPGTVLGMQLCGKGHRCSHSVTGRVVHVTAAHGNWLLGCAFAQPLADEVFQALRA